MLNIGILTYMSIKVITVDKSGEVIFRICKTLRDSIRCEKRRKF